MIKIKRGSWTVMDIVSINRTLLWQGVIENVQEAKEYVINPGK